MRSIFSKPSHIDLVSAELDKAKQDILSHHSAAEYHDAMIVCLTARIERLESYINESTPS